MGSDPEVGSVDRSALAELAGRQREAVVLYYFVDLSVDDVAEDAPGGTRLHSLHAHFLRPVRGGAQIVFRTGVLKAGRAFSVHVLTAEQEDRACLTMTSFVHDRH